MSIDPNEPTQPTQPKRDVTTVQAELPAGAGDADLLASPEATNIPRLATSPEPVPSDDHIPGDATGPAPGESPTLPVDRAGGPDRVAIAMMVGVVVLLLICVAFALAAR